MRAARADDETIARLLAGDSLAAAELNQRFRSSLEGFFLRYTGDSNTAEDLTQETFLRVLSSLSRFESGRDLRAWLFGIARHVLLHHHESVRRRRECELRAGEGLALEPLPVQESDDEEKTRRLRIVRLAVARLAPRDQALIDARYVRQLGRRQIAAVLGVKMKSVGTMLTRAKKQLVAHWERLCREEGEGA